MPIGVRHLQNIHPLIVHFPIAFLVGAALFYFAAWITKKDEFAKTGFWVLMIGSLSMAIAIGTGLYAEQGVMVALDVREHLLAPHKKYMIAVGFLCGILAIWAVTQRPFPKKGRVLFMALLMVMVGVMALGADYGGRLVYGYNAGGDACPQPIRFKG